MQTSGALEIPSADTPAAGRGGRLPPSRPLAFGPRERPLAGVFHPAGGPARDRAAVICAPLGFEALCAHRTVKAVAQALASAGVATLRFDYDGTGDSAGLDHDPGRVAAWLGSIRAAIEEARRLSGATEVVLVGLRAGATLAAAAAAGRRDVAALAMLNPCLDGRSFLRELRALSAAMSRPPGPGAPAPEGGEEAVGFLFTAETIEHLGALSLKDLSEGALPYVLLYAREDLPDDRRLLGALGKAAHRFERRRLPGLREMLLEPHKAVVPTAVVDDLARTLAEGPTLERPGPPTLELAVPAPSRLVAPGVVETALRFGPNDRLFGILTEPESTPAGDRPAVILFNAGGIHHVGPNRNWVWLSRELAQRGFRVLRLDASGLGESGPAPEAAENTIYGPFVVEDGRAAQRALGQLRGCRRFVVAGLCSGAHYAFHSALVGPRVVEAILINPLTFYWKPGLSPDYAEHVVLRQTAHYRQALFRRATWSKALRGELDLGRAFRTLTERARLAALAQGRRLASRAGLSLGGEDLPGDLQRLRRAGVFVTFVFGEAEPGLAQLDEKAGFLLRRPDARRWLRLEVVRGADHTFTPLWSQRHLVTLLVDHLSARYGPDGDGALRDHHGGAGLTARRYP